MNEYLKTITGLKAPNERIKLNNILSCEIKTPELFLHLNTSAVRDVNPVVFKNFLRNAFIELSRKLRTESSLKNVSKIVARSWIVRDNPNIFTKFGFHIDERDPTWASMEVDAFLRQMGN